MAKFIAYSFLVAGILELTIPLLLGLYIKRRFGVSWRAYAIGAVMFLLSMVRLPLNDIGSRFLLVNAPVNLTRTLLIAFPSLTAGIFEEFARFIAFRNLLKGRELGDGLMYGAGHGGIESIVMAGLNVLALGLALLFSPSQIPATQLSAIWAMPLWFPLVGLYERLMAMAIQLCFSLMVLLSFLEDDKRYLVVAIVLHFLVNYLGLSFIDAYGLLWGELVFTLFTGAIILTTLNLVGSHRKKNAASLNDTGADPNVF